MTGAGSCAGVSHMSPCISVTTEVNIGSQLDSTGQPRHCLRVPRLAVSAAVLRMSPNIVDLGSRDELGLLLGSQGFEAALIMPVRQTVTSTCTCVNFVLTAACCCACMLLACICSCKPSALITALTYLLPCVSLCSPSQCPV